MFFIYEWLLKTLEKTFDDVKILKKSSRGTVCRLRHRATGKNFILRRYTGNADVYQRLLSLSCPNLPRILEVAGGKSTVKSKSTESLHEELMEAADLGTYLKENEGNFSNDDITETLKDLLRRRRLSKATLARKSGMSDVYLHQVFSGRRTASRDRLLCLCSALRAGLPKTQDLLKRAGYAQLYAKHKRDAIIIYGLLHRLEPSSINDKLFVENEKTLF